MNPHKEMLADEVSGTEYKNQRYLDYEEGAKGERDGWLLKTDPEKTRDAFTRNVIERAYAQGIREIVEWLNTKREGGYNFCVKIGWDEWQAKLKSWRIK